MNCDMAQSFVPSDGQFYHRNCEYCYWLDVCLLNLLYTGQSTRQFDMMYIRHVFGNGLDIGVVDGQVEEVVEVVEQPLWKYLFESTGKPGWVASRKL